MTPLLPVCLVILANLDVLSSLQLGVKTRYGHWSEEHWLRYNGKIEKSA